MGPQANVAVHRNRYWLAALLLASSSACGGQADPSTTSGGVSVADQLLAAHNRTRSQVTASVNYPGTWTPLPMLVWSDVVAASAQAWADHLRDAASCIISGDASSPYGENVAGGAVGFSATAAFDLWAGEQAQYVYQAAYAFDQNTAHYTQIVWRNTLEVGCAVASCRTGYWVYVCRYSPAGNVSTMQPY